MAWPKLATLNTANLPAQFSYRPYVPRKRISRIATANAVITQAAAPTVVVHGDGTIPWTIPSAKPAEYAALFDLYNTTGIVVYDFVGYWNDDLEVLFDVLDEPTVRSRMFDISGQFTVISENSAIYSGLGCGT